LELENDKTIRLESKCPNKEETMRSAHCRQNGFSVRRKQKGGWCSFSY